MEKIRTTSASSVTAANSLSGADFSINTRKPGAFAMCLVLTRIWFGRALITGPDPNSNVLLTSSLWLGAGYSERTHCRVWRGQSIESVSSILMKWLTCELFRLFVRPGLEDWSEFERLTCLPNDPALLINNWNNGKLLGKNLKVTESSLKTWKKYVRFASH
jgi:hypothetical protein